MHDQSHLGHQFLALHGGQHGLGGVLEHREALGRSLHTRAHTPRALLRDARGTGRRRVRRSSVARADGRPSGAPPPATRGTIARRRHRGAANTGCARWATGRGARGAPSWRGACSRRSRCSRASPPAHARVVGVGVPRRAQRIARARLVRGGGPAPGMPGPSAWSVRSAGFVFCGAKFDL